MEVEEISHRDARRPAAASVRQVCPVLRPSLTQLENVFTFDTLPAGAARFNPPLHEDPRTVLCRHILPIVNPVLGSGVTQGYAGVPKAV